MKIIFMGSPDFALPSLEKLHASPHQISAVVSGRDKRRGRGSKTSPTPVKAKAQELALPVIEADDLKGSSFIKQLQKFEVDLFVVVAFKILPSKILKIPQKGSINLHASLLPKYRGAAPIHWAVINGETETGCTIFWLDEDIDTGQLIAQKSTPIEKNETTGDVYNRLKEMGAEELMHAIDAIADESYSSSRQDDSKATAAPKIFKDDCKVDFHQKALKVHNKIRGLSPFPTAWARLDELKFNMYRSKVGPQTSLEPGQLYMQNDELLVGCKEGTVILEYVQLQGKRKMSGKDFMNGYNGPGMIQ